jgi:hypothetical protein
MAIFFARVFAAALDGHRIASSMPACPMATTSPARNRTSMMTIILP